MILNISTELEYSISGPTTILLQIEAAALPDQKVLHSALHVDAPDRLVGIAGDEGVGQRSWIDVHHNFHCTYEARVEVTRPAPDLGTLSQVETHDLPGEAVKYLLDSRFIAAERFEPYVQAEFGGLSGGARIAAMRDSVEKTLSYVPGSSNAGTTALDTFIDRKGVCRDYAHLMIGLARASRIPARMVSAYAPTVEPPDFHAVVEVYLEGDWHLVDPSGMATADTLARIGVGRDAADVAFMTVYGGCQFRRQSVSVCSE